MLEQNKEIKHLDTPVYVRKDLCGGNIFCGSQLYFAIIFIVLFVLFCGIIYFYYKKRKLLQVQTEFKVLQKNAKKTEDLEN